MATPSKRGSSVNVTVSVWYDAKLRRVFLVGDDPDLPPEGLITQLKLNSQAERSSLALLAKYGKLPEGVGPAAKPSGD